MRRYSGHDYDNARWDDFEFRSDDIVIVAPSKSGTTWTQLLVALLVFDGPDFPAPLGQLSPWMEHQIIPVEEVHRLLEAQTHRRIIKSHTPLDGHPRPDGVTHVCVGRDPRDAYVSMTHHSANLDRERMHELLGTDVAPQKDDGRDPVERWMADEWEQTDSWTLDWLAHFLGTFWSHRSEPGVELFHFADYVHDLEGEFRRLATVLGHRIDEDRLEQLARHAHIDSVRRRAAQVAPEAHLDMWHDPTAFFRTGQIGSHREVFTEQQLDRYRERIAELMPNDLARWAHGGRAAQSI